MAKKKQSQKELAALRADYLAKREEILKGKVNSLQGKLFEKVFDNYLLSLEKADGKLIDSNGNINMVQGLGRVYESFNTQDNVPVIKDFIKELNIIPDLNEKYFKAISQEGAGPAKERVIEVMNTKLGIDENGNIKQNGFVDKFIRDTKSLKNLKKITNRALRKGQDFISFKDDLKEAIIGSKEIKDSGMLHQYYRNYAYDTYQQMDRLNGVEFAKALELRYFIYSGGLIKTSRPFCIARNGKIIDSQEFRNLERSDLPENQQSGIPDDWNPMIELGGYGCRHSIDWVTDSFAERNTSKFNQKAKERRDKFKEAL